MRAYRLLACLLLVFGGYSQLSRAQQEPSAERQAEAQAPSPESRPRVGLVLSGGGARGAAHIGVLEVLEELHVPVDFIVGTSMGAIVGGMYASGLSPEAMRRSIAEVDWHDAFTDAPARRNVAFRQKEDDDKPLFALEFGFDRRGLSFPSGFVAGQKLNFIIRSMLLHAAEEQPFDRLPIPFRAIAADLETGEMVVLDRGDLATAIRASMSFPAMFTPVQIGERYLVDGGVVRNLPVDVALGLGADHVIAVDVGSPLGEMIDDPSAMGVIRRTVGVMANRSDVEQRELLRDSDLLITPDLEGIGTFDGFDRIETAAERGREAARREAERLRELAVASPDYEARLERQRRGTRIEELVVGGIDLEGLDRVSPKLLRRRVRTQPGAPLDLATLRQDLERIYQIGEFEQVGFQLRPVGDEYRLVIQAQEKSWGPWYLRLGLAAEANLEGRGQFAATGLVRRTQLNALGAEWKTFFTVGQIDSVETEFYQPLDFAGRTFLAPRLELSQDGDEVLLEDGGRVLAQIDRAIAGLDLGVQFGNYGEIRLGLLRGDVEGRRQSGDTTPVDIQLGGYQLRATLDQFDNANFPRAGLFAEASLLLSRSEIGADTEYDRLFTGAAYARSFGRQTWLGSVVAGTDLGSELPFYADFSLGGFLALSGLERGELAGDRLFLSRLVTFREQGALPSPLGGSYYVGGSLEAGSVWQTGEDRSASDLRLAGSVFAGFDTVLGPVFLAYGRADQAADTFYLFFGQVF